MPRLTDPDKETFAHAKARGKSVPAALAEAGRKSCNWANTPEVLARIDEIKEELAATPTLGSITLGLARVAALAEGQKSAAGLAVARGSLMDLARLHDIDRVAGPLESGGEPDAEEADDRPMTAQEWQEKYGPKD